MSNENQSAEKKIKHITLKSVIAWIFGIFIGLAGVSTIFNDFIVGLIFIISAIIVFPPTYNFLKNKLHISLSTGLKVGIVVILFVIAGVFISKNSPTPSQVSVQSVSIPAPIESQPQTAPVQAASTPAAPAPAPQVLLNISGSGSKSTETFTAAGDWQLSYTFDCSNFGSEGNFSISIQNDNGGFNDLVGPNELAQSGSDTDYYHEGGAYYLEINSECNWTVKVKG